jgi:hypothetical protein
MRNVVNVTSEEAFNEVYERALERIQKMSYIEFVGMTGTSDYKLLMQIEERIAEAMAEDYIKTGEW